MENSGQAPQKTKNTNAYDPAIPLLRSYQKEMKSADKKYIYSFLLLFIRAKIGNQLICPPICEREKKIR